MRVNTTLSDLTNSDLVIVAPTNNQLNAPITSFSLKITLYFTPAPSANSSVKENRSVIMRLKRKVGTLRECKVNLTSKYFVIKYYAKCAEN